jgi:HEAT repeat protein
MAGAARHDTNVAQAVPVLIEIARNPVRRYRAYAVSALGTIGLAASNTVPCILSCLDDHDQTVRSVAIETLGQIGPPAKSAVPAIRKLLQDQNDSIRRVAADALWRIDSEYVPLALSIFIEMLNQRSLRGDAPAYSLDQMGPRAKQALPTLARLLDDPDPLVRLAAAKAFWHIDPSQIARALPALGSLTEEPDFARVEAIMLLGEIGPAAKAALPRIQACLNDEDVEIHRAAVQAVCSISVGATPTPAPSPGSPPRVP